MGYPTHLTLVSEHSFFSHMGEGPTHVRMEETCMEGHGGVILHEHGGQCIVLGCLAFVMFYCRCVWHGHGLMNERMAMDMEVHM